MRSRRTSSQSTLAGRAFPRCEPRGRQARRFGGPERAAPRPHKGTADGNIPPMGVSKVPSAEPALDKPVREQLRRMLDSVTFQQVDRLKRFLTFIVGEALAGRRN